MTVAEYEVKFDQLSRYAMHLVATEQDKCNKFEAGLRMEIKKGISARDMHTFTDLREAALRAERLIEEEFSMVSQEHSVGGKRKGNFPPVSSTPRGKSAGYKGGISSKGGTTRYSGPSLRPRCPHCEKRHEGECWLLQQEQTVTQRPKCPHCEKRHEGECRAMTGACFGCGEMGHQLRQCPYRAERRENEPVQTVQNQRTPGRGGLTYT